ncbi:MFS transporter [Streptomyces salinarius]|uniref:MFS transporter n=1 Tax=Streptomyces salinarius TaxID=2762598 RepID=UPI002852777A|nr:MFS transporter [Streptomyces salinarius]
MISWGVVATAMAFVNSVEMFYALRFLLGVAEAGFFPAVIYYFSRWLPDSHRGRATSIFLMGSGTATVIVGPISGALMEMHGIWGHAGWQWMFFVEGVFSVVLGFVVYRFLDSGVEQATWLTDEEKSGLVAAVDAEQEERDARRGEKAARVSRWKLLADPQMLLFLWIYFAINVALYAVTFWLPSIVDDIGGVSDFQVGLLTAVPWLCALVALFVSGRVSDRIGRRRPVLVVLLLLGGCGTLPRRVRLALGGARRAVPGRDGLQTGLPGLLDDPAELPGRPGRGPRHRADQLHRQPRRVRRPHRVRHHRGLDRLDQGRPGRPHRRRLPGRAERPAGARRRAQRPGAHPPGEGTRRPGAGVHSGSRPVRGPGARPGLTPRGRHRRTVGGVVHTGGVRTMPGSAP